MIGARMKHRAQPWLLAVAAGCIAAAPLGCSDGARDSHSAVVTASAYNSVPAQTKGDPTVAAWGDKLKPGMKAIAVSRDLLERGLTRGAEVRIEGLSGTFKVLDKMNARWTRRIDIFMGKDVEAAREWGKQQVTVHWN